MGSYELKGDQLTFSRMAGTMMACAEGLETEKAFLDALTKAKTWRIEGQQLELFDGAGKTLARFEARPAADSAANTVKVDGGMIEDASPASCSSRASWGISSP